MGNFTGKTAKMSLNFMCQPYFSEGNIYVLIVLKVNKPINERKRIEDSSMGTLIKY